MCDPKATAQFSLGTQIAGGVTSAAGNFIDATSSRRAARANEAFATLQAEDAIARGKDNVKRFYRDASQFKGKQRANLAASGVVLTEGSPMQILAGTDKAIARDASNILENANRESYGYRAQAANYKAQGDSISPFLSASTSLLTTASKVAPRWAGYKAKGISPFGI